jgi:rod shape-determining protein MreD
MTPLQWILRVSLAIGLALFVQGVLVHGLLPAGFGVNLLVVLAVFLAFYDPTVRGLLLCFLIGIVFDIQGARLLGPWAGAFVIVFAVLNSVSQHIFVESTFTIMVSVFLSTVFSSLFFLVLSLDWSRIGAGSMGYLLLEATLTALVAPLVFKLLRRVFRAHRIGSSRISMV